MVQTTSDSRVTSLVEGLQALLAVKLNDDAKAECIKQGKIIQPGILAAKSMDLANKSLQFVCDQRAITELKVLLLLVKTFGTSDELERSPIKEKFRADLVDLIEGHIAVMEADQEVLSRDTLIPSK